MSPTKYLTMKMSSYYEGALSDACFDPENGKRIASKLRVHLIDDIASQVFRDTKSTLVAHDVEKLIAEGIELSFECDKHHDPVDTF